jgi:hypothetical protein
MALSTYDQLKTSIANYLNRSDLDAVIPDFITLTERRLDRDIRARANMIRANTTTVSGTAFYTLPADMLELRNIVYDSSNNNYALAYMSPESLSREYGTYNSGAPRAYSIIGEDLKIAPTPDGAYTLGINYYQALTPLSSSVSTNNILDNFPELYLFGACAEGAVYLNDNEQLQRFSALYLEGVNSVRTNEESARYSGTVMTMSVQGDPGGMVRRGA